MPEVTVAQVDQAASRLVAAKKKKDPKERHAAAQQLAELRSAWRAQEEAAGRRSGIVGGTAEKAS